MSARTITVDGFAYNTTAPVRRYRLLRQDFATMAEHGTRDGDHDALDAMRSSMDADPSLTLTLLMHRSESHAYRAGIAWEDLSVDDKVNLSNAYRDAYGASYIETYEEVAS